MNVLAPTDLPTGYSARRAFWRMLLVLWALGCAFFGLFHVPNAVDEGATTLFYIAQIVSCGLVAWLDRRDTEVARWTTTALMVGTVMAIAGFAGPRAALVFFVIGLAYMALVWKLPSHPRNAKLSGLAPGLALLVVIAILMIDVDIARGERDATLRDDACFVWCE